MAASVSNSASGVTSEREKELGGAAAALLTTDGELVGLCHRTRGSRGAQLGYWERQGLERQKEIDGQMFFFFHFSILCCSDLILAVCDEWNFVLIYTDHRKTRHDADPPPTYE